MRPTKPKITRQPACRYRPLIASSLAAFLSAGIAGATEDCMTGLGGPTLCYAHDGTATDFATKLSKLEFIRSGSMGPYRPEWAVNYNTTETIQELHFKFNAGTSSSPSIKTPNFNSGTKTLTIESDTDASVNNIQFKMKGLNIPLQIGNQGTGKLVVDFGTGSNGRVFELTADGAEQYVPYSFDGGIEIIAGDNAKFDATFEKGKKGDITIKSSPTDGANFSSSWTFNNDGAKLDGNFDASAGKNSITFTNDNGSITGNIKAANQGTLNTLTFEGNTNSITGDITTDSDGINQVIFEESATSTITGNITAKDGLNEINGGTIAIHGNIKAENGLNIIGAKPGTTTQKITIDKGSGADISITASGDRNDILADALEIEVASITSADFGANDITSTGIGKVKVANGIQSTGANNNITLQGANSTFTSNGSIKAEGQNQITSDNDISVENGSVTIKSTGGTPITITSTNGMNTISAKTIDINVDSIATDTQGSFGTTNILGSEGGTLTTAKGISTTGAKDAAGTTTIAIRDNNSSITSNGSITATNSKNTLQALQGSINIKPTQNNASSIQIKAESTDGEYTANFIEAKNLDIETDMIEAINGTNEIQGTTGSIQTTSISSTGAQGINKIKLANTAAATQNNHLTAKKITASDAGTNLIILDGSLTSGGTLLTEGENSSNQLVFRSPTAANNAFDYTIETTGGDASIVLQNIPNTAFKINYSKSGSTTLFFARSNKGGDTLNKNQTATENNKVLGRTYEDGIKLTLADKIITLRNKDQSLTETYAEAFKKLNADGELLNVKTHQNATTRNITITGLAIGSLSNLEATTAAHELTLSAKSAFIGDIGLNTPQTTLSLIMEKGSKLILDNNNLTIKNLTLKNAELYERQVFLHTLEQPNTIIDLATSGNDFTQITTRNDFRLLTIGDKTSGGGITGQNALFRIYINTKAANNTLGGKDASQKSGQYGYAYSDRVIVHDVLDDKGASSTTPLSQHLQVFVDSKLTPQDIANIAHKEKTGTETEGNIAVLTTKGDAPLIQLEKALVGFDIITTKLAQEKTDAFGKVGASDYTTYFIDTMSSSGISKPSQQSTTAALGASYDLYLANLNSLNKRMGELRENTGDQGVWARVFHGMQTSKFDITTQALYTTIQAGYDHAFGSKGANNYLGFALSYANAMSRIQGNSQNFIDANNNVRALERLGANAVELAFYNAYVQDGASKATGWKNGFYSDSILKLSAIMSNFNISNEKSNTTTNFALSFSQELGYRFLLGEERAFYIDPQVEMTLGYLSASSMQQTLGQFFLNSTQDAIFTLRSRAGSSFGYKFDKFTQNKGFNSSLYLGTYFVGDFISGGNVQLHSNFSNASLSPLESTTRFVLNLGTNFKIKDNTRIYFDFERSFGGRITTDYQLNLGVRYSFGTSKYTPYTEANTQEIKDSNTLKEVEPTQGYYIEVLEKEANKLTAKEKKVLEKLKDNLKVQSKTQGNKTMKVYLVGAYKDESKAKEAKTKLEGVIKELRGKGSILEVE